MSLIFLHVPKCAGTSIITALRGVYGKDTLHDQSFRKYRGHRKAHQWQSRLPLTNKCIQPPAGKRCIAGHFTHMKYKHLRWPTFVFLRHPYSRVVSQYSVRRNRLQITWEDYVRSGENSISRMVGDLNQYFFVGLQEHFNESVKMLEWYAGIKMTLVHRNHRRVPIYEPTDKEKGFFFIRNQPDVDLYEKAEMIFEEQREEYGYPKS